MKESLPPIFAALADPTRLGILSRLTEGEADIATLAAPFDMSQPAISHHVKVLIEAGLIERRRQGTRRPCRLRPDAFQEIDEWLARFSATLETNYARLDALLKDPNQ